MNPESHAHVAAAALNQTVGDWSGNTARIEAAVADARERGVRLLLLPEMCIPGYSLGDRVLMNGTLERSWRALTELLPATAGLVVCLGLPVRHRGVIYNAVAVVADGRLVGVTPKTHLAIGDVQYENRWYAGWTAGDVEELVAPDGLRVPFGSLVYEARGIGRFAIEICEDGWKGLRPGSIYALAGARVVLNPSASWFTVGKHRIRRRMVEQISREDYTAYVYASLLGCDATRLVFDGSAMLAQDGRVLAEADRFRFDRDHVIADRVLDLGALDRSRAEEGSWRQQVEALHRGGMGWRPQVVQVPGDFTTSDAAPPPSPYWLAGTDTPPPDPSLAWLHREGLIAREPTARDLPHLELELALSLGLREYLAKCGIPGITLALSGGRDSAMCAVLAHRMVRYDEPGLDDDGVRAETGRRLTTAYLWTEHSTDATRGAAADLAAELGARHLEAGIQDAVDLHARLTRDLTGVTPSWDDPAHDLPLQNVQARLRGSLIWMVANLSGTLLVSTSNKSEAAVGYATMDGDTSGGLAPIADVPKSLVTLWLRWAADFHGYRSLERVLGVPATAELRPHERAQTDEGDLMPYAVLDELVYQFVQLGHEPLEMFRALWPSMQERYGGDARAFAGHIRKFVQMLCRAQWKRERFAISFRVTAFDLDPKTGFRFPPVQAPFTDELAELDAFVAAMAT